MVKTTPEKKRRITLKKSEGHECREWSKKHGHDTYGPSGASDCEQEEGDSGSEVKRGRGKQEG